MIADNIINISYKHSHIKLKPFQKENQFAFLKITKLQQGTVLFKYDVTDRPTSFFYRGKRSALFFCRARIEIVVVAEQPPRCPNVV